MTGFFVVAIKNGAEAKVDEADFERVNARRWYAVKRSHLTYAESCSPTQIMLHRFILNDAPVGAVIDHINGDQMDNRRSNLRVCTQGQNARNCRGSKNNRSGFKGVSWKTDIGKWRARIMIDRREISLGAFESPDAAARAYDVAAAEYFGEFARFNFGPPNS